GWRCGEEEELVVPGLEEVKRGIAVCGDDRPGALALGREGFAAPDDRAEEGKDGVDESDHADDGERVEEPVGVASPRNQTGITPAEEELRRPPQRIPEGKFDS